MLNGLDAHFAGPLQALNLRAQRSEVLASNIANADTPNYKARDFDFAAALSGASGTTQRVALARTSVRHLGGAAGLAPGVALQYRVPIQRLYTWRLSPSGLWTAAFTGHTCSHGAASQWTHATGCVTMLGSASAVCPSDEK